MAGKSPSRLLADKLNHLFATVHPAGRGPYSNEEVAAAIRDRGGPTISAGYVWLLRKGERDNPTKKHLEALAEFFGVPAAYFFDDELAERIESELAMLSALRDAGIRALALRMAGLPAESLQPVAEIVELIRKAEGLDANRPGRRGEGVADDPW